MAALAKAAALAGILAGASAFEFLAIGDWGDQEAKTIAGYMGEGAPEFVLAIGDNF